MAIRIEKKACLNCAHWAPSGDSERYGDCRRNAPVLLPVADQPSIIRSHNDTLRQWPKTQYDEVCGEHEMTKPRRLTAR